LDWERLRAAGRLPLFGVSYTALLLIPPFFFGLGLYNDKIVLLREWAKRIERQNGEHQALAALILERLHTIPLPADALLTLGATVLLALASTLYAIACPSRIKEFSRDQWCDQLGHSTFTYWPLAWRFRWIRVATAAFYLVGGLGAMWVISRKMWHVALFIWRYSYV